MKIIYHHRTRAQGAEGVHICGVQQALKKRGVTIYDISLVKVSCSESKNYVNSASENSLKKRCFNIVSDVFPNVFFKIFELLYPIKAVITCTLLILKNKFQGITIDFIYDRYAYFNFALPFVCKITNIPLILEVNTTCLDHDVRKVIFLSLSKKIEKFCFERSSIILVVSGYLKNKIIDNYNVNARKIKIFHNAVDPDEFYLEPKRYDEGNIKDAFYFSKDRLVIGFVGVFVPWHGIDFLLDVFSRLCVNPHVEGLDIGIMLVGDGPIMDTIKNKVKANHLFNDKIFFTGMVKHSDIKHYINLFDIAIMPDSNHFGSPMKIFEYMIMGLPVIAPRYEPIEEVITHNINGILFEPRNECDCEDKMCSLLINEELRIRLGRKARELCLQRYTWEANIERLLALMKNNIAG